MSHELPMRNVGRRLRDQKYMHHILFYVDFAWIVVLDYLMGDLIQLGKSLFCLTFLVYEINKYNRIFLSIHTTREISYWVNNKHAFYT